VDRPAAARLPALEARQSIRGRRVVVVLKYASMSRGREFAPHFAENALVQGLHFAARRAASPEGRLSGPSECRVAGRETRERRRAMPLWVHEILTEIAQTVYNWTGKIIGPHRD
jgi:hypothetical protein